MQWNLVYVVYAIHAQSHYFICVLNIFQPLPFQNTPYLHLMFSSIQGQDHIANYVVQAAANEHLPHTMLLSGKAGYGLFPMAMAITKFIMCSNRADDACGQCANCFKVDKLQHPDLHIFFPTSKSKVTTAHVMADFREMYGQHELFDYVDWIEMMNDGENLNINADIIADINKAFGFKSFEDGPRVFLIWGAEYLGQQGNKLLKVIEEPPEDAYIILMAENRHAILTTILSRCQTQLLKPLSTDAMLSALSLEENDDNIQLVQAAIGDLKQAKVLMSRGLDEFHHLWLTYLRAGFKGHPTELLNVSGDIANRGKSFCRQFIHYGIGLISKMLRSAMGIPLEEDPAVEKLAQLLDIKQLEDFNLRLQEDFGHVNRNAKLNILFASQALWIHEMFKVRSSKSV